MVRIVDDGDRGDLGMAHHPGQHLLDIFSHHQQQLPGIDAHRGSVLKMAFHAPVRQGCVCTVLGEMHPITLYEVASEAYHIQQPDEIGPTVDLDVQMTRSQEAVIHYIISTRPCAQCSMGRLTVLAVDSEHASVASARAHATGANYDQGFS